MKVKIAYTVNIEDVPTEVSEIMTRAANDLDEAYQAVVNIQTELDSKEGLAENHLKSIETARSKMVSADQVLQDCQAIIIGLKNLIEKTEEHDDEIQIG